MLMRTHRVRQQAAPSMLRSGALTVPMRGNVISTLDRKNRDEQTGDEKETAEQKADDRDF